VLFVACMDLWWIVGMLFLAILVALSSV